MHKKTSYVPALFVFLLFFSTPILLGSGLPNNDAVDDTAPQYKVVPTEMIYQQKWDTLPQVKFWQYIMQLSPDTGIMNVKDTRQILHKIPVDLWDTYEDSTKDNLRDSLRVAHGLDSATRLYFTTGKQDYYSVPLALPGITKAVDIFKADTVDPFYAQAILLIESPGKLERSRNGAYGQFQLMRKVAAKAGLQVYGGKDERSDFEKSAQAAAYLMRTIYIPAANQILTELDIAYDEDAFWYKLLVLHCYHAGAYNVKKALEHAGVTEGNNELILTLWRTQYRRFGNASQNYTQLVLAAHLHLEDYLKEECKSWGYCE